MPVEVRIQENARIQLEARIQVETRIQMEARIQVEEKIQVEDTQDSIYCKSTNGHSGMVLVHCVAAS